MKITDLITDYSTGQMSHSKLWANIGYASMSSAFVMDSLAGGLTDMKLFAYGAVVAGSATASKIVSIKAKAMETLNPPSGQSKVDNPE